MIDFIFSVPIPKLVKAEHNFIMFLLIYELPKFLLTVNMVTRSFIKLHLEYFREVPFT